MYCPNCGKEVKEDASFCINCGVAINGEPQKNYAKNSESSLAIGNYNRKAMKEKAKEIIAKPNVHAKSTFVFGYGIPAVIIMLICNEIIKSICVSNFKSAVILNSMSLMRSLGFDCGAPAIIIGAVFGVILSLVIASFITKANKAIKGEEVTWKFEFNKKIWLPILITTVIITSLEALNISLNIAGIYMRMLGVGSGYTVVSLLIGIIFIVFTPSIGMIVYTSVSREYSLVETLTIGFKLGFKHFGKLWLFALSYIPLSLLIGLTLGILSIWKGFYMITAYCIMQEQILQDYEGTNTNKEYLDMNKAVESNDIK